MPRGSPRVSFVTRVLPHYRVPFHERVRSLLADYGVEYVLIHGQPNPSEAAKGDLVTVPWATFIRNLQVFGKDRLVWQPVLQAAYGSDLVILGQENRLLINYLLQALPKALRPKLALWGHGPNFLSADWTSPGERWRKWWAPRCDWWFAYTEASRSYIEETGFPRERITVFNNAIDTDALRSQWLAVTPERLAERRAELGLLGNLVGIYVGAIYDYKRIDFLVASADRIHALVPDFELLVVGSGVEAHKIAEAAATRPWLRPLGSRFGADKVELMRLAKVFIMPGLLGLAVLDAGATRLPVMTTNFRHHSPEIVYLENGVNGVVTEPAEDVQAYAAAVAGLLRSPERLQRMAQASDEIAQRYTIDEMVRRFVDGTLAALHAEKR